MAAKGEGLFDNDKGKVEVFEDEVWGGEAVIDVFGENVEREDGGEDEEELD